MKNIIFSSVLLLLLVGVTSLAPSTKVKYSSSEAKLSVTFPGEFTTTEKVEEAHRSSKTTANVGGVVYLVSYTIHDNDMADGESLAKVSLDAFINVLEGEVTEESRWVVNKNNGFQAKLKVVEKDLVGEYRVVLINQIQYQITVIAPEGLWDNKKAKKFFKSFKVAK
ncbi:MAG: hypothetical protein HRT58_05835 [Crocinitomicaceae bacterium]|nr:hypothetical protein [Flavobacteriales bacterium]NQZ35162.1 hypothetical protein [Crocinitomicaceae bacterium]